MANILDLLFSRPSYRRYDDGSYRYNRYRGGDDDVGLSLQPNAPKMTTILLSIVLTVAGLVATGTVDIAFVADLLLELDLTAAQYEDYGHYALIASPALLVIGSFFRGI